MSNSGSDSGAAMQVAAAKLWIYASIVNNQQIKIKYKYCSIDK